ncbi:pol [Scenedesmus sp. PABB004]|nr:pol [Scenedesmus sp. PABB004]
MLRNFSSYGQLGRGSPPRGPRFSARKLAGSHNGEQLWAGQPGKPAQQWINEARAAIGAAHSKSTQSGRAVMSLAEFVDQLLVKVEPESEPAQVLLKIRAALADHGLAAENGRYLWARPSAEEVRLALGPRQDQERHNKMLHEAYTDRVGDVLDKALERGLVVSQMEMDQVRMGDVPPIRPTGVQELKASATVIYTTTGDQPGKRWTPVLYVVERLLLIMELRFCIATQEQVSEFFTMQQGDATLQEYAQRIRQAVRTLRCELHIMPDSAAQVFIAGLSSGACRAMVQQQVIAQGLGSLTLDNVLECAEKHQAVTQSTLRASLFRKAGHDFLGSMDAKVQGSKERGGGSREVQGPRQVGDRRGAGQRPGNWAASAPHHALAGAAFASQDVRADMPYSAPAGAYADGYDTRQSYYGYSQPRGHHHWQQARPMQPAGAAQQRALPPPELRPHTSGGTNRAPAPCPYCRFGPGHAVCWYDQPNKAPANWAPGRNAEPGAVQHYLRRCKELKIQPAWSGESGARGSTPAQHQRQQQARGPVAAAALWPEYETPLLHQPQGSERWENSSLSNWQHMPAGSLCEIGEHSLSAGAATRGARRSVMPCSFLPADNAQPRTAPPLSSGMEPALSRPSAEPVPPQFKVKIVFESEKPLAASQLGKIQEMMQGQEMENSQPRAAATNAPVALAQLAEDGRSAQALEELHAVAGSSTSFEQQMAAFKRSTGQRQTMIKFDGPQLPMVRTSGGRVMQMQNTATDSGCVPSIINQRLAQEMGLHVYRLLPEQLPPVSTIEGQPTTSIIGRTEPVAVILGHGTEDEVSLELPDGFLVVDSPSAYGMYGAVLGRDIIDKVSGFVLPFNSQFYYISGRPATNGAKLACMQVRLTARSEPAERTPAACTEPMPACTLRAEENEGEEQGHAKSEPSCSWLQRALKALNTARDALLVLLVLPVLMLLSQAPLISAGAVLALGVVGQGAEEAYASATKLLSHTWHRPRPAPRLPLIYTAVRSILHKVGWLCAAALWVPRVLACCLSSGLRARLSGTWRHVRAGLKQHVPWARAPDLYVRIGRWRYRSMETGDVRCLRPPIAPDGTECNAPRKFKMWRRTFTRGFVRKALPLQCALLLLLIAGAAATGHAAGQLSTHLAPPGSSALRMPRRRESQRGKDRDPAAAAIGQTPLEAYTAGGEQETEELSDRWEQDPEHKWIHGNHPELTAEQKEQLQQVLLEHKDVFAYEMKDLVGYKGELGPAQLRMKTEEPIICPERKPSPRDLDIGREKVREMLDAGVIREVSTHGMTHACPIVMAAKRAPDGTLTDKRFCYDGRAINANAVIDKYKLPLPEELFRRMAGATWRSKVDCRSGFFNIPLDEASQRYACFWWEGRLYSFTRLPFGHVNATAIFQRIMEHELRAAGLKDFAVVFVDDICIYTKTFEDHLRCLRLLFGRFRTVGLRAHPSKTVLCSDSMPFLGHLVSESGMQPDQAKVAAMRELAPPTSADQVRSYLGVLGFYRCYVPEYSAIAAPLNALLKKGTRFVWGPEQAAAFDRLRDALTSPTAVLRHPDPSRPYHLYTDWSPHGISAVLNQRDQNGGEYMVACASRSLNEHERRYEAWKGEALAAVWGVKTFRPYLQGPHFHLHTDHRPLLWLLAAKEPTGQHARWVLSLQDYEFTLVHKAGKSNVADVPSRHPRATTVDAAGARLDRTREPMYQLQPAVLQADGTPDTTEYTWELLEQQRAAAKPQNSTAAGALLLGTALAPPSQPQLQAQLLERATAGETRLDSLLPDAAALLAGNNGSFTDAADQLPDDASYAAQLAARQLARSARAWVQAAVPHLPAAQAQAAAPAGGAHAGPRDAFGVRRATGLATASVAASFFPAATQGLVLVDAFGGLCAGLEMALRGGKRIHKYLYVDINPTSRAIAAHRVQQLTALYPDLLPTSALQGMFSLPQDVREITTWHLVQEGASLQRQPWLVVGGWPCQDLSTAGSGAGLRGARSGLLTEIVRLIGTLQQLQPDQPPCYLLENVPVQWHSDNRIAEEDFKVICDALGQPTVLDAAQFGSRAHRVRAFWTNACSPAQLAAAAAQVQRPPGLTVSQILEPGRREQPVKHPDFPPRYPCNVPGQPMAAWPTLMAHPNSYSFRPGKPGSVIAADGTWDQPLTVEPERALGYAEGATAAPGVSDRDRRRALGEAIDAACLAGLWAIAQAWAEHGSTQPVAGLVPEMGASKAAGSKPYGVLCALAAAAEQDALQGSSSDIWADATALHLLQNGDFPAGTNAAERSRVAKRRAYYRWQGGQLLRLMPDNSTRVVPPPAERRELLKSFHDRCGHFGVRRTAALAHHTHWWHGLLADAASLVGGCPECGQVRAAFTARPAELQPLPIRGMMYRWGVDLCGPFPRSERGHRYILVCVEHFSKNIEAIPIAEKTPECTAYAFLHNVLARFGACAEVVHDRGGEWQGAFQQLLLDCLIDSRPTSANHPAANGAAEKSVHIVKAALEKTCLQRQAVRDWDMHVPWLLLGYRCSPQRSTGLTPYELLYARAPIVPPAVMERLSQPLDLDAPDLAAADLAARRQLVERLAPEAMANLEIAQQRDTLRYARLRSGEIQPRTPTFKQGDFVYVAYTHAYSALQPRARPVILRVLEVRPSGRLMLQGRCGRKIDRHISQCAPCHLPGIDPTLDPALAEQPQEASCEACGHLESHTANQMLLCDHCDAGWHQHCLEPSLDQVPEGDWMCPRCVADGVTQQQLQAAVRQRQAREQRDEGANLYPDRAMRERDEAAKQLHGRLVRQHFVDRQTGQRRLFWGRAHFMGEQRRPAYFDVCWEDGDVYRYATAELTKILTPQDTLLPAGAMEGEEELLDFGDEEMEMPEAAPGTSNDEQRGLSAQLLARLGSGGDDGYVASPEAAEEPSDRNCSHSQNSGGSSKHTDRPPPQDVGEEQPDLQTWRGNRSRSRSRNRHGRRPHDPDQGPAERSARGCSPAAQGERSGRNSQLGAQSQQQPYEAKAWQLLEDYRAGRVSGPQAARELLEQQTGGSYKEHACFKGRRTWCELHGPCAHDTKECSNCREITSRQHRLFSQLLCFPAGVRRWTERPRRSQEPSGQRQGRPADRQAPRRSEPQQRGRRAQGSQPMEYAQREQQRRLQRDFVQSSDQTQRSVQRQRQGGAPPPQQVSQQEQSSQGQNQLVALPAQPAQMLQLAPQTQAAAPQMYTEEQVQQMLQQHNSHLKTFEQMAFVMASQMSELKRLR